MVENVYGSMSNVLGRYKIYSVDKGMITEL